MTKPLSRTGAIAVLVVFVLLAGGILLAVTHPPYPVHVTVTGPTTYSASLTSSSAHEGICVITGYSTSGSLMGTEQHAYSVTPGVPETWTGSLAGTSDQSLGRASGTC